MSSETPPTRGVQNAKKEAMENAVWLPEKTQVKHRQPVTGSQPQHKSTEKQHYVSPGVTLEDEATMSQLLSDMPDSQDKPQWGAQLPTQLDKKSLARRTTHQRPIKDDHSESEEAEDCGDSDQTDLDAKMSDSEFEDPRAIANTLSTEIPSFVSGSKTKKSRDPTTPVWPNDHVSESEESCNDSPAAVPKSDASTFATSRRSISTKASSKAGTSRASRASTTQVNVKVKRPEEGVSDTEHKSDTSSPISSESSTLWREGSRSSSIKLILTECGKVKLTDQDIETRKVVQGAILKMKAYMTFTTGYPELTEKASYSHESLLKAACDRGATAIEKKIQTDVAYVSALAGLGSQPVEARVLLFRGDLKDKACNQVSAYLRLGSNSIATSKVLLENHRYHYFMKFDDNDVPQPMQNRPYLGNLMVHLMKGHYANGPKSVGVVFTKRFADLSKNKAKRPEVTIPTVALTATSVYAALFWKSHGSPPKFNFTGNQFSEVYFFHVKFLENVKAKSPEKFHKLMADLFATIHDQNNNPATDMQDDALAFLDLDGMDED
ncbi:hypothetical protein DFH29DRAFT_872182 [Suillus ampliporus]|nr:hypothetical protein DFH29DRAFT_872182 [Suillus ampliporus]